MKRAWFVTISAVGGLLFCFVVIALASRANLTPRFPAFAGEQDFSRRFSYFVLLVCPAFTLLGAGIGLVTFTNWSRAAWLWGGVIIGTGASFTITHLLLFGLYKPESRDSANLGALGFLIGWIIMSAFGAIVATRLTRNKAALEARPERQ